MSLRRSVKVALLVGSLLITACAGDDSDSGDGSETGGSDASSLRVVNSAEPDSLNWFELPEDSFVFIHGAVYDNLIGRDVETLEPTPALATEWEETSPTSWQLTLREGVKFSDGSDFTAQDVVDTVTYAVESESLILDNLPLASAEAVDDQTVVITLSRYISQFPAMQRWLYILPSELATHPDRMEGEAVGTGPYTLTDWTRGQKMEFEENPDYWGTPPAIPSVSLTVRDDPSVRIQSLTAGEADFVFGVPSDLVDTVPKSVAGVGADLLMLRPNVNIGDSHHAFDSTELRQAIAYAIDRDTLADVLYGGYADIPEGLQLGFDGFFGFAPSAQDYEFDLDRARSLVEESGIGQAEISLVASTGRFPKDSELAQALVPMLEDAGLNVSLELPDYDTWISYLVNADPETVAVQADLVLTGAGYGGAPTIERVVSSYLKPPADGGSVSGIDDPALAELIASAEAETELEPREAAYQDVMDYVGANVPLVPLFRPQAIYGMADDLSWTAPGDGLVYPQDFSR
jgi:peptide/nickel transport system substrate-binding protein